MKVNPTSTLLGPALNPKTKLAAVRCARGTTEVVSRRDKALEAIKEISKKLDPLRQRWSDALPEGSPARRLNLPLSHCITTTMDYEDVTLVKELMRGMPISGPIAKTNVLIDRVRPAQITTQEWLPTFLRAIGRC